MTHTASPFMTSLARRFAMIVAGVCSAVAACGGRKMVGNGYRPHDPAIVPLIVRVWGRLQRAVGRFER